MGKRVRDVSLMATMLLVVVLAAPPSATETVHAGSALSQASTTAPAPVRTTPATPSAASTTGAGEAIVDPSAAVAAKFLAAREDRDLEAALGYLDKDVVLDWGPGTTYDTLALGWAWEDAFRVDHVTDSCDSISTSGETTTVLCRIRVDSAVAAAAGKDSGHVCATVVVTAHLITHLTVDSGPGCEYVYWPNMFVPFETWLKTAHPDTTIGDMYDDRISEAGLELWAKYTDEFLAAHG